MQATLASTRPGSRLEARLRRPQRQAGATAVRSRAPVTVYAAKGFGSDAAQPKAPKETTTSSSGSGSATSSNDEALEALESKIKRRREARVEPKVKVNAPVVEAVTGGAPLTPVAQAETTYVNALGAYFAFVLAEGIVLASSGFLPEAADTWIRDYLYPSYSPQVLLFLGGSSVYGLWKTGKLPGQAQQAMAAQQQQQQQQQQSRQGDKQ